MSNNEELLDLAIELENVCNKIENYNNSEFIDEFYAQSLESRKNDLLKKSYDLTHGVGHNIIYVDFS